jgi:hypothetical protein
MARGDEPFSQTVRSSFSGSPLDSKNQKNLLHQHVHARGSRSDDSLHMMIGVQINVPRVRINS